MTKYLPSRNRLAQETSPYLQQHANNPVDWYAWGPEALEKAKCEDKPILLSVGYSACHWCHVMAHESFEDAETAALMNELFVNIKVDREERPDLDQIYQTAHGVLTQRNGGWPLTMFLMPDQTPFFAGTYFPKTSRYGMPGFKDVIAQIAAAYRDRRNDLEQQNEQLRAILAHAEAPAPDAQLRVTPLDTALRELKDHFDEEHGGLGNAPKFPHPVEFGFCLRRAHITHDDYALGMVRRTLTAMAEGGIYDQLGGGFCRYSVDGEWTIPHFEKMLYDNALLLALYTDAYSDAWHADPQPLYQRVVADTATWVMREMQSPVNANAGGYYSSLDADSEHEEGKFYVWTPDEVRAALSVEEYAVAAPHYGLTAGPNFEAHWNLRITQPLATVAQHLDIPLERAQALLDAARAKLFAVREKRIRPGRDEKILTSWNALMIKGMARAARAFDRPDWLASARAALEFIRTHLWKDGRLLATHKDGKSHLNAYLDDHAFLLDALLELMQHNFRSADLEWANALAQLLLEQFENREHGGFFFTSHDHETLIQRAKTGHDGAIPSGNGIATYALQRLGHLAGEPRYLEAAERALHAFKPMLDHQASSHTSLCIALEEYLEPPTVVILRGTAKTISEWQTQLAAYYSPRMMVVALPDKITGLPAALDKPLRSTASAWVCHGTACLPPIDKLDALFATLKAN
jgi:uncharacterized protein YyaL (SSP411 family)